MTAAAAATTASMITMSKVRSWGRLAAKTAPRAPRMTAPMPGTISPPSSAALIHAARVRAGDADGEGGAGVVTGVVSFTRSLLARTAATTCSSATRMQHGLARAVQIEVASRRMGLLDEQINDELSVHSGLDMRP